MTKNPTTSFRLDEQTLTRLDDIAGAMGVSRAEVVRQALAAFEPVYRERVERAERFLAHVFELHDEETIFELIPSERGHAQVLVNGAPAKGVQAIAPFNQKQNRHELFICYPGNPRRSGLIFVGSLGPPARSLGVRVGDLTADNPYAPLEVDGKSADSGEPGVETRTVAATWAVVG